MQVVLNIWGGLKPLCYSVKDYFAHCFMFVYQNIMEENRQKLSKVTLAKERRNITVTDTEKSTALLVKRQNDAINMQNGIEGGKKGEDGSGSQEHAAVLLGASIPIKNTVRAIRLPEVKRLPPYTTWMFLDRFVKVDMYFKEFVPLIPLIIFAYAEGWIKDFLCCINLSFPSNIL